MAQSPCGNFDANQDQGAKPAQRLVGLTRLSVRAANNDNGSEIT